MPSAAATELVEHFINMFPNMDPGFVSDVVLSEEVNGDKDLIHQQLVGMGGIPVDGEGLEIDDEEQDNIEEVQNFIVDCNEHMAEFIGGLSRPENFNKELLEQLETDIEAADAKLDHPNLHAISRDGLETMIREANELLACYGGMAGDDGQLDSSCKLEETMANRMGADPQELERLREELKKEKHQRQVIEKQLDTIITERDSAKAALRAAEKHHQAAGMMSPRLPPAAPGDSSDVKALKQAQEESDKLIESLKEENLKLMTAFRTLATSTKRTLLRARESHAEVKQSVADELSRMTTDFTECQTHVKQLKQSEMMEKLYKKMEKMYKEEMHLRKQYYNTIQELRGNIRVFARVRPLIGLEKEKGTTDTCVEYVKDDNEVVVIKGDRGSKKYNFNKVFGPGCTQTDIFQDTLPLIDSVVDGYNVCIFAYGQTGSGKSYTMEGPSLDEVNGDAAQYEVVRGVNRRAVDRMFSIMEERKDSETTTVYLSVLEIYCEKVRDLLGAKKKKEEDYKVRSGMHPVGDYEVPGNYVEGLIQVKVESSAEVTGLLDQAKSSRKEGCTDMNSHSSRSHMILSLVACTRNVATGAQSFGKLNLIDLAGSERLSKTHATGQTAEEAKNINSSLACLSKVIYDLQSGAKHVNYRDSKLTHLLQDSLGGQSKVLMFANCSPATFNQSETKSTLDMASRAMKCSLGQASKNKLKK